MSTTVAPMVQQPVGLKAKIELAMQLAADRQTRLLLKEVLKDLAKPADYTWLRDKFKLSPAEFRVLELIFQGKSRKDIARELSISPATVGAQTQSIYKKCRVSRTSELMALVLNHRDA